MRRHPAPILVGLLIVAIPVAGCVGPYKLDRVELLRLHGFEGGDAYALKAKDGTAVPFTQDTKLGLVLQGGEEIVHRYSRVEVIDGVFYGGVTNSQAQVAVDLRDVDYARVWSYPEGEGGTVAIMVFTMWIVFGVIGFLTYLLIESIDWDDVETSVVIVTR